jgi:NadR type nicotinamide-nucleotide adenylyltransferase
LVKSYSFKIVLFGPESTGKTTLAGQLAAHYQTVWVPEFSRFYQEQKGAACGLEDVIPIAEGQLQWEAEASIRASRLLICDTDILETKVYSQIYNGTCPPWLLRMVEGNLGDLYLLTDIDLPWVPDGIRDRPHQREEICRQFRTELEERNLPFAIISGDPEVRLQKAIRAVDEFLRRGGI